MFKKYLILALIFAIIGFIIYITYSHKEVFKHTPWQMGIEFKNVSIVESDDDNNIYFIDQSLQRFVHINKDHRVQTIIDIGDREGDYLYLAKDFAVDNEDNIYLQKLVLDNRGIFLVAEEIVKYSAQGEFIQTLYSKSYELEERMTRPGQLLELVIENNLLHFYKVVENELFLQQIDFNGENKEEALHITLPNDVFMADIAGIELGSIYYSTKRAELFHINHSGESEKIYSSDERLDVDSFPVHVSYDQQGRVYFVDIGAKEINRLNADQLITLLTDQELIDDGQQLSLTSARGIFVNDDQSVTIGARNHVINIAPNDELNFVLDRANFRLSDQLFRWLVWGLAFFACLVLVYAIRYIYIIIMQRRISITVKQLLIFIPIILISLFLIAGIVFQQYSQKLEEEIYDKLKLMAHTAAQMVDTERMERITKPEDFMNEDFKYMYDQNHFMLKGSTDLDSDELYSAIYAIRDEEVYVLMYYNTQVGTYYPLDPYPEFETVMNEGKIITTKSYEADGVWMFALGPIYNASGDLIGMQEIGMTMHGFDEHNRQVLITISSVIGIIIPIILIVFMFMTYYLLAGIRKLSKSVEQIAEGKWDTTVSINSKDEVADLGNQFNEMARQIGQHILEVKKLSESYFRFVPQELLEFLGKKSILHVELGDQVEQEMAVLVSNIRSFYAMSREMTPEENFNFINEFLDEIGPVVRNNNGLINKYLGSGILALFPNQTEHAVQTAVHMRKALHEFNSKRQIENKQSIDIGIGIHKGPLMLGILGEGKRLEGNVISDDVNISVLLENYSQKLGASILVSDPIYQAVNHLEDYKHRNLGLIKVEDMDGFLQLYDIYEGDTDRIKKRKDETKEYFEEGIRLYQEGRFLDARTAFLTVIKQNDQDLAAKRYFYLCDEFYQKGTSEGWKGTLSL